MVSNDRKFGFVKGVSDRRRLPLLGKIRLGKKVQNKEGKTYPKETEYFVVPPEIAKIYGDQPKELDIMIPVVDRNVIFPTAYRLYGSTRGLKCIGNGETANCFSDDKKSIEVKECPCEKAQDVDGKKAECKIRAFFMVMVPRISLGGVYQICTGSFNSIVDINSGLDYVEALVGRLAMVPMKLVRAPMETHNEGKKQTHYTMKVLFDGNADFVNQLRENNNRIIIEASKLALPAPKDVSPEEDPVDETNEQVNEETGEVVDKPPKEVRMITANQKEQIQNTFALLKKEKSWTLDKFNEFVIKKLGKATTSGLEYDEAECLISELHKELKPPAGTKTGKRI